MITGITAIIRTMKMKLRLIEKTTVTRYRRSIGNG